MRRAPHETVHHALNVDLGLQSNPASGYVKASATTGLHAFQGHVPTQRAGLQLHYMPQQADTWATYRLVEVEKWQRGPP